MTNFIQSYYKFNLFVCIPIHLGFDPEEVLSYDEMIEIEPDPAKKRPIVLIGEY